MGNTSLREGNAVTDVRTIDEYIARFDGETKTILQNVRAAVRAAAPEATERIGYGMPALYDREVLVYFAAAKDHIGLYPTAGGVAAFADRLSGYSVSKGTIRFPYGKPVPYDLIAEITAWRAREAAAKRKGRR